MLVECWWHAGGMLVEWWWNAGGMLVACWWHAGGMLVECSGDACGMLLRGTRIYLHSLLFEFNIPMIMHTMKNANPAVAVVQ